MLQKLLGLLFAHPRVGPQLIQRLSETWPIRRAARFTAYLYLRGKQTVEEGLKNQANQQSFGVQNKSIDFSRFKDKFKSELQKGIEEAKEDLRRRQK